MTPYLRHEGIQHRNRQRKWKYRHPALTGQDIANDDMIDINKVDAIVVKAMMLIVENQLLMMMGE